MKVVRRNDDYHRIAYTVLQKTPKKWTTSPSVLKKLQAVPNLKIKQKLNLKTKSLENVDYTEDFLTKSMTVLKIFAGFHPVVPSRMAWPFTGVFFMGDLNYRLSLSSDIKVFNDIYINVTIQTQF